jgi:transcriptional regulator GlxA family with amidase domain
MAQNTTIGVIVFDGVLTAEVMGPAEVFAIAGQHDAFAGMRVLLIGVENQPTVRTEEGIQLVVNATIADDLTLDVLLAPGGNDVDHLLNHVALNAFIRKQEAAAQWVGSMCAGAFILGSAGVLDGVQATTWYGGEADLQAQFPAIQVQHDVPVVVDNRRITANGGLVSYRAALVLLGQMGGADVAAAVHRSLNMDRLGTWADVQAEIDKVTA